MNILVVLLVLLVVAYMVPFPAGPWRNTVLIILAVLLVLWALNVAGLGGGPWISFGHR